VPNAKGSNQHSEVNHQNDGQPNTAERLAQQQIAEEIGEAVGLERRQVENEVTAILESFLKLPKVQFSDDYQPPAHPDWTQQQIADAVGCTKGYVSQVFSKTSQCNNSLNIPDHIKTRPHQADFRKLPPELQQKVAAKEVSLNAAAIQAEYEKAKAKERYDKNVGRPKAGEEKSVENFPQIKSRDAIGARVGVSDPGHLRQNSPRR